MPTERDSDCAWWPVCTPHFSRVMGSQKDHMLAFYPKTCKSLVNGLLDKPPLRASFLMDQSFSLFDRLRELFGIAVVNGRKQRIPMGLDSLAETRVCGRNAVDHGVQRLRMAVLVCGHASLFSQSPVESELGRWRCRGEREDKQSRAVRVGPADFPPYPPRDVDSARFIREARWALLGTLVSAGNHTWAPRREMEAYSMHTTTVEKVSLQGNSQAVDTGDLVRVRDRIKVGFLDDSADASTIAGITDVARAKQGAMRFCERNRHSRI